MSPETLQFFAQLLPQVQLRADDPDFDDKAALISRVRRDLSDALATTTEESV